MTREDNSHARPYCLVGITGGYGSGKSTVAAIIAERYPVLNSDDIARELTGADPLIREGIRKAFGQAVFDTSGALDRAALASVVFSDAQKLALLNSIVHPRVIAEVHHRADALHAEGHGTIFVESALIFEAGIDEDFDFIIAVLCDEEAVVARLTASGFTAEDILARINSQIPAVDKSSWSDVTIRNNGSLASLRANVSITLTVIASLCKTA